MQKGGALTYPEIGALSHRLQADFTGIKYPLQTMNKKTTYVNVAEQGFRT